jgi:hypothetical protein
MNKIGKIFDKTIGKILTRYLNRSENLMLQKSVSAAYYNNLLTNLSNGKVLPYNSMSISPSAMMLIVNHILIHDIKYIVEFGTGISTIFLNNLSKKNNLDLKIISVDHDADWQKKIKENYDLEFIEFVHAPLINNSKFRESEHKWYNMDKLNSIEKSKVGFVIIDGPLGAESPFERAGAFNFFKDELNRPDFSLLLDDTNLPELEKIMEFYCPGSRKYNGFTVFGKGFKYYVDPVLFTK